MNPIKHNPMQQTQPPPAEMDALMALFNKGRHPEVENRARSMLDLYPDAGLVWQVFGISLHMQGKDSLSALQKTAYLLPDNAGVHNNLGNALYDLGQLDGALASYRRAVELNPDFAMAHNNLANVLKASGQYQGAVASYRRVLELKPDSAETHFNMGVALQMAGKFKDALASYRRAVSIDPQGTNAMLAIGYLCSMENGEFAEAENMYRKVLEIDSNNLDARILITRVNKAKNGDENLAALVAADNAVGNGKLIVPADKVISLQFALGKSYDDLGEFDQAFRHFSHGCQLKRATVKYDAEQMSVNIAGIIRKFDSATMASLRGGGHPSQLPIFVVGMPRSGTTLTEQIIASHPDVHGAGELPNIMEIAQRNVYSTGASFPSNNSATDQVNLVKWASEYIAELQGRAPNAKRITDKMPGNFLAIGLIHAMLPNAKIIHVSRNPVDTCLSCFTQLFEHKHEYSYVLSELGQYYSDYSKLMSHWRTVLPAGALLDVQYEDIVADPETLARRMLDYCGLDWNDACIQFHRNKRPVHTLSMYQVRQPIYKSSVERWRSYEKFLGPLLDSLGDLVQNQS